LVPALVEDDWNRDCDHSRERPIGPARAGASLSARRDSVRRVARAVYDRCGHRCPAGAANSATLRSPHP
jgi:hypothetical protein